MNQQLPDDLTEKFINQTPIKIMLLRTSSCPIHRLCILRNCEPNVFIKIFNDICIEFEQIKNSAFSWEIEIISIRFVEKYFLQLFFLSWKKFGNHLSCVSYSPEKSFCMIKIFSFTHKKVLWLDFINIYGLE